MDAGHAGEVCCREWCPGSLHAKGNPSVAEHMRLLEDALTRERCHLSIGPETDRGVTQIFWYAPLTNDRVCGFQ